MALAATAICFFAPDIFEGRVLQQHDIQQGIANGQEVQAYEEATGETSRWTNALFGGMPNFQIAPSYAANAAMGWLQTLFGLGLPSPANLLFMMMAGFFVMCLCMKMKWPLALFASIAWGFSTYFVIIIGAGHIWKFATLAYIPPTIGGLALLYRGKYLGGTAMTALFATMQLMSNHPQMSYYFMLVMLALVVAWGIILWRRHEGKRWLAATGLALVAGLIALGANSASIYNSFEYSKETVRGQATLIAAEGAEEIDAETRRGMDHDAITAWSYGLDETFSLLIPNVKGGATIKPEGGNNKLLSLADTDTADGLYLSPEELQFLSQFPQYFGDQPMTNGPVYVGALVLLLAILAMFTVSGPQLSPVKWALFAASVLGILLAWGHNFAPLTDFMIDTFPGYNKFRAVASILVIPEFCIPLLAAMELHQMVTDGDWLKRFRWTMISVFGLGALICLVGWVSPSIFGTPFSALELSQLQEMGILHDPAYANIFDAVRKTRLDLVSGDSLRSLLFILIGWGVIWLWLRRAFKSATLFLLAMTAVVVIDLFSVCKRYVNTDNFTDPMPQAESFEPTKADRMILADKALDFRVADLGDMGGARSSYFHKTIGGYHAAKLTRYNDLLTYQLQPAAQLLAKEASLNAEALNADSTGQITDTRLFRTDVPAMDMLNTRYYMIGDYAEFNPNALGNAWFVDQIDYVATPREEMERLSRLDPRHAAVASKDMQAKLGNAGFVAAGDTISMVSYAPDKLVYRAKSSRGGLAVFSEIYFPWGWEATVDGAPAEIGRVNYVLRAMKLPAGEHEVVMTFRPRSLEVTNAIGIGSVIVVYLLCGGRGASRKEARCLTLASEVCDV